MKSFSVATTPVVKADNQSLKSSSNGTNNYEAVYFETSQQQQDTYKPNGSTRPGDSKCKLFPSFIRSEKKAAIRTTRIRVAVPMYEYVLELCEWLFETSGSNSHFQMNIPIRSCKSRTKESES